jgi:hypothetical protein
MFDRIMENSMAIWMLISAAFPVFAIGTLIKAFLRFRRLRTASGHYPAATMSRVSFSDAPASRPVHAVAGDDWVPSR